MNKTKLMKTIATVESLIAALHRKTTAESYLDIMKRVDIPLSEFEKYFRWSTDHHARNCLVKTDNFELLLICYERGQETPIHDYDAHQAWIHTIQGKLKEERFQLTEDGTRLEQVSSTTLSCNDYSFLGKVGIHRYKNIYEARSISLNLYCKPIEQWNEYDEQGHVKAVEVSYDSVYE